MTGVYIKGMEMPTSCHECVAGFGGYCFVASAESDGICPDHGRPDDCPLVELPPHGDLIDRQALLQEFYKAQKSADAHGIGFSDAFYMGNEICAEWWAVERKVEDAPVIIPAEEGE